MTSVLNKLLEIAACGLGAVGGPLLAPWRARREAKARIIAAEADAEVLEIRVKAHVRARALAATGKPRPKGELDRSGPAGRTAAALVDCTRE